MVGVSVYRFLMLVRFFHPGSFSTAFSLVWFCVILAKIVRFLADHTIGRAFGTMCRLSSVCRLSVVVCDVLYCGKTVRPS